MTTDLTARTTDALRTLGVDVDAISGSDLDARSPLIGQSLFGLKADTAESTAQAIDAAYQAHLAWREVPAPVRGQTVARLGELLTEHKQALAELVTVEAGKIKSEALGEVQEMIDICQFAQGLSRQLYGKTMPSERAGHRLQESWHPMGVVGVISAFNFPVAVWSWNTALALVTGNAVVWKPSEATSLTAIACTALLDRAIADTEAPSDLGKLIIGDRAIGEVLVDSPKVAVVSATGSTRMGREVGPRVAARFGRSILELGGNNAAVVAPSADLAVAVPSIVFAAAGTAGQRCTSTRRLIVHESVADEVVDKLAKAYDSLAIGDPFDESTLVGPLINADSYERMQQSLAEAKEQGGELVTGGDRVEFDHAPEGHWVKPAIVRMPSQTDVVMRETFAPILYVITYTDLAEAIQLHNAVPQGLSSGIFTSDQAEAERFISAAGADCGIVNVNTGTSGAEIGGAFGGEKETGGGRESGTDAWQGYMRRQTTTINYSGTVQLAQGVDFG
ncbi:L-piperidine-6-carboxylate dehydrogenase [Propionibacteriaceae bacterium Y1685]